MFHNFWISTLFYINYQSLAQNWNEKLFLFFHEKGKLISSQCGTHGATRAHAWRPTGTAHVRPAYSARQPTAWESRARRHISKNAPRLWAKQPAVYITISIVSDFATKPSDLLLFTTVRPSTIPARAGAVSGGTGAHASHTRPMLTYLWDRHSTWVQRDTMGGGCTS